MSLKRKSRNSTLMTRNYLDLGSACGYYSDLGSYASSICNFCCSFLQRQSFLGETRNAVMACLQRDGLTLLGLP